MTIKQLIKNITKPGNFWYIIQSKIRQLIRPLPDTAILEKVARHPNCFFSGECQRCGCDFHDVLASDKKCDDLKKGDIVAYLGYDNDWVVQEYDPNNIYPGVELTVLRRVKDGI